MSTVDTLEQANTATRAQNLKQAKIMSKAEKLQLKGQHLDVESSCSHEMAIGLKPSTGLSFSLPSTKRRKLGAEEDDVGWNLFGSRLNNGSILVNHAQESDNIDDTFEETTVDPSNRPIHFHDDVHGLIDRHKRSSTQKHSFNAYSTSNMDPEDVQEAEDLVLSDPGKLPLVRVPGSMNAKLFDYQREGVRFLYNLYVSNRGGILADDMGLGKTVQTICFIMAIKAAQPSTAFFPSSHDDSGDENDMLDASSTIYASIAPSPVLIVTPASLLQHWHREFYRWTKLRTYIAHGKHDKLKALDDAKANRLDVVLISYETLASSVKLLNDASFSCIVFDEAHRVKNLKTKLYTACSALKVRRKYGLTGTVMQNSFEELWTLCHVLGFATSAIGDLDYFKKHYLSPIKEGHVQDASNAQISRASIVAASLVEKLSKFILRRTKQCIAHQLPPKEDHIVFCAPTELQLKIYKRITDSPLYRLLRQNSLPCSCGSGLAAVKCCSKRSSALEMQSLFDFPKVALPALTRLQQLANHVSLIVPLELVVELQNMALLKRRTASNTPSAVVTAHPHNGSLGAHNSASPTPLSFGIDQRTQSHLITNFFGQSEPNQKTIPSCSCSRSSSSSCSCSSSSSSITPTKSLRPNFPTVPTPESAQKGVDLGCQSGDRSLSSLIASPFLKMAFGEDMDQIVECLANGEDLELCGKLKVLASLLPHWHSQDAKVLLFSSSTRLMETLARFCTKLGFSFGRLEGTTPIHQRQRLVDQFNKTRSQFIFIVSTKACGVGLNLSSANVVVIFEPHFNVSLDMQASDRAHRIGQVRTTRVYRLVSAFTIEELTYRRQIYKQQMANIATEGRHEKRFFKMSEVFGAHLLFSLLDRSQLNTVDILERENTFGGQKDSVDDGETAQPPSHILAPLDPANADLCPLQKLAHSPNQHYRQQPSGVPSEESAQFRVTRDHTSDALLAPSTPGSTGTVQNALFQLILSKSCPKSDDLLEDLAEPASHPLETPSLPEQYGPAVLENDMEPDPQKHASVGRLDQSELEDMDDILRKAGALHSHLNSELFSKNVGAPAQQVQNAGTSSEESLSAPTGSSFQVPSRAAPAITTHRFTPALSSESLLTLGSLRSTSLSDELEHLTPAFVGDGACRKSTSEEDFPELM